MRDVFGNIQKTDIFGNRFSKKSVKRYILKENKIKGRAAEDSVVMKLQIQGYEVERSPKGKDFIARRRDLLTGKVRRTVHVEVKSGKSKLSKLQLLTKKKKTNYRIIREDPYFY